MPGTWALDLNQRVDPVQVVADLSVEPVFALQIKRNFLDFQLLIGLCDELEMCAYF